MSKISNIGDVYNWSIAKIAEAFGMDRKAVKRRLLEANIPVADTVRGNAVYSLRAVGPALFSGTPQSDPDEINDPSRMTPKDRKDWYQSENERIKLETSQRKLLPADEVIAVYSAMRKAVVQVLDTLPDVLERDCALSPQAVEQVQKAIDDLRHELATRSYEACAADFATDKGEENGEEE
ncbi:DUF1441 family protein [Klebsiella pneumoniae]|nr:DUF1441 family protein [Klebsiella pneumoniae]